MTELLKIWGCKVRCKFVVSLFYTKFGRFGKQNISKAVIKKWKKKKCSLTGSCYFPPDSKFWALSLFLQDSLLKTTPTPTRSNFAQQWRLPLIWGPRFAYQRLTVAGRTDPWTIVCEFSKTSVQSSMRRNACGELGNDIYIAMLNILHDVFVNNNNISSRTKIAKALNRFSTFLLCGTDFKSVGCAMEMLELCM